MICVCMYMCIHVHVSQQRHDGQRKTCRIQFSFYRVDPRDGTSVIRLAVDDSTCCMLFLYIYDCFVSQDMAQPFIQRPQIGNGSNPTSLSNFLHLSGLQDPWTLPLKIVFLLSHDSSLFLVPMSIHALDWTPAVCCPRVYAAFLLVIF